MVRKPMTLRKNCKGDFEAKSMVDLGEIAK